MPPMPVVPPRALPRLRAGLSAAAVAAVVVVAAVTIACAPASGPGAAAEAEAAPPGATTAPESLPPDEASAATPAAAQTPPAEAPEESETEAAEPSLDLEQALHVLFPDPQADATARDAALAACPEGEPEPARIGCLIAARFADDADAAALAVRLYETQGTVAGVEAAFTEEVGWRGRIEFVPALPVGKARKHLEWVVDGLDTIDTFMRELEPHAAAPLAYRWRALAFRFYRTVDRTTPSAYASGWRIAYNLQGSLMKSKSSVRETLVHELFHLNDFAHDNWSERAIEPIFDAIVARCMEGKEEGELPSTKCLKPYAPGTTKVKGGTYYAFQPGNGVHEYTAELAVRYFLEQRAWLDDAKKKPDPFKCATDENAQAWQLLVDEFFGGVDLVPACAP